MSQTDLEGVWWFLCDSMNRFGPRLRESSLPASLAQILANDKRACLEVEGGIWRRRERVKKYRTGRHGARRTMSLHRKKETIQNTRVPGSVCVGWRTYFPSLNYFAHDRLKNLVWFTVFSKKKLNAEFVDRVKSMESVCLLQDNIILLTSRGEEVARVRYQEVNAANVFVYWIIHLQHVHTYTHTHTCTYIYIYIRSTQNA